MQWPPKIELSDDRRGIEQVASFPRGPLSRLPATVVRLFPYRDSVMVRPIANKPLGTSAMAENNVVGSCLCGNVTFEISGNLGIFQYCHCSRCRKFSGSAFASNLLVNPDQISWLSGKEWVGRFEHPDARHFATAFCRRCGSSLPWLAKSGKAVIVPAGTLDDDPETKPFQNIFCASRATWYVAPSSLPEYDELPPSKR